MPLTAAQAAAMVIDEWDFWHPDCMPERKDAWVDGLMQTMRKALKHAHTDQVGHVEIKCEVERLWQLTRNNCEMLDEMAFACEQAYAKDNCRGPRRCSVGEVRPAANFIDYENFKSWTHASSPLRMWMYECLVDLFGRLDVLVTAGAFRFLQTCLATPPGADAANGCGENKRQRA